MNSLSYNTKLGTNFYVQKLQDLVFFSGDTITIPFVWYDGDMEPIDLRRVDVYWYLCPYGQYKSPAIILSDKKKDSMGVAEIVVNEGTPNLCYVNLSYELTKQLNYIKYSYQPVLVLKNSRGTRRYIRAEGDVIFRNYIHDFVTYS